MQIQVYKSALKVVKEKVKETIKMLSKNAYFDQWKIRIQRCRYHGGEYIKDDSVKIVKEDQKDFIILIWLSYIFFTELSAFLSFFRIYK